MNNHKLNKTEKQLVETKRKNLLPKVKQIAEAEVSLLASKKLLEENKQTLVKHQVKNTNTNINM